MIISIETDKMFDKIQYPPHDKNSQKIRRKRNKLPLNEGHIWQTRIVLNGKMLKALSPWSAKRQGCWISPLSLNKVLESKARAIRQEKEKKSVQNGKEKVKLSLFAGGIIIYIENLKALTKNFRTQKQIQ